MIWILIDDVLIGRKSTDIVTKSSILEESNDNYMIKKVFLISLFLVATIGYSQYNFDGQIANDIGGKAVYLSIVEDYRRLSRPYPEQIIKKTKVDSLGYFNFQGDNLSSDNRIYRIHIDKCSDESLDADHFFGRCENSHSILFIANNKDTINFPTSFADETLCKITSTNANSETFLQIDALKEEMAFDFYDFPSEASRKLNAKKWFSTLQHFGQSLNEPLAELYIYDFLSDKRNETYSYYLKDIAKNTYYTNLEDRLELKYPNTVFTNLYTKEIAVDQQMVSESDSTSLNWIWAVLLGGSILLNLYFLWQQRSRANNRKKSAFSCLTAQEQKIVTEILKDKTNKEIASDLFISLSTVKTHINNLYKKLSVTSREEIKTLFS